MWIVKRAVDGITLNKGKEYLVDDEGKVMKFSTMVEVKKFLARHRITEMEEIAQGIEIEEVPDNE